MVLDAKTKARHDLCPLYLDFEQNGERKTEMKARDEFRKELNFVNDSKQGRYITTAGCTNTSHRRPRRTIRRSSTDPVERIIRHPGDTDRDTDGDTDGNTDRRLWSEMLEPSSRG